MNLNISHIEEAIISLPQLTFEVTQNCNLYCEYCAYGKFYNRDFSRNRKNLPFSYSKSIIDYLANYWTREDDPHYGKQIYISFYGGEPLLNFGFIEKTISYLEAKKIKNRKFIYSMTSNAMLLNRYMNKLVKYDFKLLISLDGNEFNHSYRIDQNGNNSFSKVFQNVILLQKRHPEYFKRNVNFNSVLHNRNSVSEITTFIKKQFDKLPSIGELSTVGILEECKDDFEKTYQNKWENINNDSNHQHLKKSLFLENPDWRDLSIYLHKYSGNVFNSYIDLLSDHSKNDSLPTGTCLPFGKKMFITAEGLILPCEKIAHNYKLGEIKSEGVLIDFANICRLYNNFYTKLSKQCSTCYAKNACSQCIFTLKDPTSAKCERYISESFFEKYEAYQLNLLRENPELFMEIMENAIIN
jgi:uncharacterized protein